MIALRRQLKLQPTAPCRVLFVCLGNICRSPLAKAIFTHHVAQRGLQHNYVIDSCGTGNWHIGRDADPRTHLVASAHGIVLQHTARQVNPMLDFDRFDVMLAMDERNRTDLLDLGAPSDRVWLFRRFDPLLADIAAHPDHTLDVPDPYYGSADGFERVFGMLWRASEGLIISTAP